MKVSPEAAKRMGIEVGKVMRDPRNSAFMSEEQIKLVGAPSLKQMALKILAEERAKLSGKEVWKHLDSKVPCALKEKNPPKVEDKTEAEKGVTKAKAGDDKIAAPIGGKKVTTKSPKYTPLSGLVPAKIKRADKDEVPTITDNTEEEEVEEESIEDLTKPEHMVKLKEAIFGEVAAKDRKGNDIPGTVDWDKSTPEEKAAANARDRKRKEDPEHPSYRDDYGETDEAYVPSDAEEQNAWERNKDMKDKQWRDLHDKDVDVFAKSRPVPLPDFNREAIHIGPAKIWRKGQNTGGKLDDPEIVAAHRDAVRANNAKVSKVRGSQKSANEFIEPSQGKGVLDGSGESSKGVMGSTKNWKSNIEPPETKAEGIRRMANMLEAYSRKNPLV